MNALTVVVLIAGAGLFLLALAYIVNHERTNVQHLRSFTPVCPDCGRDIHATSETAADEKTRLRDHVTWCEAR
jgi:hypothetical protein